VPNTLNEVDDPQQLTAIKQRMSDHGKKEAIDNFDSALAKSG
tara:strand:+ start:83 stop:208 length:126 start_codon:yes stop_codon:yes gene_type:complete